MLGRLRSQLLLHQRRSVGSSRKLPKNKPLAHEPPVLTRPSLTSEAEQPERPKDFRSPWLFKAVGVGNFIIIPVIGIYAAFYWDWGDDGRENVMQPARRWLKAQKDAFFNLSPPEQQLATPGLAVPPLDGTEPSAGSGSGLSTAGLPKGFFKPFFLVKDINPEGPAAMAGLRNDDLIVTFGETPVRDLAPLTYRAMIRSAVKYNVRLFYLKDVLDAKILAWRLLSLSL
ncbi:hypothetical protein B0H11DRAFT_1977124 [Mycena galericulata]|nr:hypothetical protein B0H11DRAFT_1977124 [Mycena galericulata]